MLYKLFAIIMSLPCSAKHKKPVCDKCTAGTHCTKCCLCQPRSRGRPRKDALVAPDSEEAGRPRSNPERQATVHHSTVASATRKCMHPELTSKVSGIIHQCWQAGNSTELGKVKISVDGVFARLDEMQLQKVIRISELPLAGKIRSVYQSIGRKPEAPRAAGRKRGRMQGSDGPTSGQKKARITYEQLDLGKNVSQWKKHKLEAYLCHHRIAKTGNKPELVMRVSEHMQIA